MSKLLPLNINSSSITVSGHSSGSLMSLDMHVILSNSIKGASLSCGTIPNGENLMETEIKKIGIAGVGEGEDYHDVLNRFADATN